MPGVAASGVAASLAAREDESLRLADGPGELKADSIERVVDLLAQARAETARHVIGQDTVVDLALMAILSGGHGLLIGAPGLAKTLLVKTLGTVLGLDMKRVQFTPDLMPADILGSEVLEEHESGRRDFRFIRGPVFCQLLMADEINRASPRTQSALLQAMQEHHVTIAGARRDLPEPFHVLATQNPIEQEGTYPLPEAQLDRFLLQIDVGYPDEAAERRILEATTGAVTQETRAVMRAEDLCMIQQVVRRMPVGESVARAALSLVRMARPGEDGASPEATRDLAWGPGPRAGQALLLASRAAALMKGAFAPSTDDIVALARPVLAHRVMLNFAARAEGRRTDALIDALAMRATGG